MKTTGLYKVLRDGKGIFTGFEYALPKEIGYNQWEPGEWTEPVEGDLIYMVRGYHLTIKPRPWWYAGEKVYEADYRDMGMWSRDKEDVVCRQVRLLRQVYRSELEGIREIRKHTGILTLDAIWLRPRIIENAKKMIRGDL